MGVHLQLFAAQSLVDFDFDRQAMAVPSGHVGRVESRHGLGLHDEILQAFIQRVAQVDRPVGVGRAIVQDVNLCLRAKREFSRKSSLSHSSHLGSFWGRLAFMGKSVLGRFNVFFGSSGVGINSPVCCL